MKFRIFEPPSHLSSCVRFFWMMEKELSDGESFVYRAMADSCAEMIFHYKSTFDELLPDQRFTHAHSLIHAQTCKFRRFKTEESFGIFGVYLFPTALPQLFSIPSTEFSDRMPDLRSVLGRPGAELEEKMMLAKDNEERVRLISTFLEKRLLGQSHLEPGINEAIRHILNRKGKLDVKTLADRYCLSIRQFERKFKLLSGFSPKLYCRIVRFQAALSEYGNRHKSLTEIAYDCGYYDQSHFIHDFKAFSGYAPRVFFSGKAEGAEFRDV